MQSAGALASQTCNFWSSGLRIEGDDVYPSFPLKLDIKVVFLSNLTQGKKMGIVNVLQT